MATRSADDCAARSYPERRPRRGGGAGATSSPLATARSLVCASKNCAGAPVPLRGESRCPHARCQLGSQALPRPRPPRLYDRPARPFARSSPPAARSQPCPGLGPGIAAGAAHHRTAAAYRRSCRPWRAARCDQGEIPRLACCRTARCANCGDSPGASAAWGNGGGLPGPAAAGVA